MTVLYAYNPMYMLNGNASQCTFKGANYVLQEYMINADISTEFRGTDSQVGNHMNYLRVTLPYVLGMYRI